MLTFFCFFFLSGFCSLVFQVIWLRLAMAEFGVTTALVSIVLSVFMVGLALGSWAGGKLVRRLENRSAAFFLSLYGGAELVIGAGGITIPPLLKVGRALLAGRVEHAHWGSFGYYLASAGWVLLIMLPFCTCMGATFPLAMASIRARFRAESDTSFSYLYLANVAGAMCGTLGSAFVFIELMGFSETLLLASGVNALIAASAFTLAARNLAGGSPPVGPLRQQPAPAQPVASDRSILPLLFTSGLCSLGMEVVWTRQFVPFLGPVVYCFATILAAYLAATAAGSRVYRSRIRQPRGYPARAPYRNIAVLAGCCALLPLLTTDPRLSLPHNVFTGALRVIYGVGAFCGVLGFLTPMLLDRWSLGDPDRGGKAYAVNILGCIVGPLLSGFLLLPIVGERWTLVLLSLPFFAFGLLSSHREAWRTVRTSGQRLSRISLLAAAVGLAILLIFTTRSFESLFPGAKVRRDHTATVIAIGQGMDKKLLVNGVGITSLTPITKMMAHLPLAFLESAPRKILVLCFGMGTSFRSALSWGVPVTVVELAPSVPRFFGYFHKDGDRLLRSPRATVVIDDARRFLERTQDRFDVIIIDPPPPVEAAGSSLLYSREFYSLATSRLQPGGIVQQWLPGAGPLVTSAFAQALHRSFPDVRVFPSIEGWGLHFLGSSSVIRRWTPVELAARLPADAARDLLEWGPHATAQEQLKAVVEGEIPLKRLIEAEPNAPMLTDDRPVNEYYFLRQRFRRNSILTKR